jgi:hypothetical protein
MRFGQFVICGVCHERPSIEHPYDLAGEVIILHICAPCLDELNALIAKCEEIDRWLEETL